MLFLWEIVGEREGWARMRRGGLFSVTTSRMLRAHLGNHMQLAGSDQFWRVVSRSGWQHGAYVLPNAEVVGSPRLIGIFQWTFCQCQHLSYQWYRG